MSFPIDGLFSPIFHDAEFFCEQTQKFFEQKQFTEAEEVAKFGLIQYPNSAELHERLVWAMSKQRWIDPKEVEKVARRGIGYASASGQSSVNASLHERLVWAIQRLDERFTIAESLARQGLRYLTDNTFIRASLHEKHSWALEKLNDDRGAIALANQGLACGSQSSKLKASLHETLARSYRKQGRIPKAEKMEQKAHELRRIKRALPEPLTQEERPRKRQNTSF